MEFNKLITQLRRILRGRSFVTALADFEKNINIEKYHEVPVHNSVQLLDDIFKANSEGRREMTFYLLLNSCSSKDIQDSFKVGLFIDDQCHLSPKWVVYLICHLQLHAYFFEAIKFGPSAISIDVAGAFILLSLKTKAQCFPSILNLLKSLWHKINSLSEIPTELISIFDVNLQAIFNLCQDFDQPIHHFKFVNFLRECLVENETVKDPLSDFYDCGSEFCSQGTVTSSKKVTIEKCLQDLITCVGEVFAQTSCDVWISWSESKFPDSNATIQRDIGNSIYHLLEHIKFLNLSLREDLNQCLNHLRIRPLSIDDEIKMSDLETILDKLQIMDDEYGPKWYKALLNYPDAFCNKDTLLKILSNLALAETPDSVVCSFLSSHWKIDHELQKSFLDALKTLEVSQQVLVLKAMFIENNTQSPVYLFQNGVSQRELTEEVNKISSESNVDQVLQNLIKFIIQDPTSVFLELFRMTLVSSENHGLCFQIIDKIKFLLTVKSNNSESGTTVFEHIVENIISSDLSDKQSGLFTMFLESLIVNNILVLDNVEYVVTSDLEKKVAKEDWTGCKTPLEVIKLVFSSGATGNHECALLVFLASLLDIAAWNFEVFETKKVEFCTAVMETISCFKLSKQSEKDKAWASFTISKFPSIVQTAFPFLWEPDCWMKHRHLFEQLIFLVRCKGTEDVALAEKQNRYSLTLALCQMLPVLHREEWNTLYSLLSSLTTSQTETPFCVLSEAVTLLALCTEDMFRPCFLYCMTNYTSIFMKASNSSDSSEQLFVLCKCVLRPIQRLKNEGLQNQCYLIVTQKLGECAKKLSEEHFGLISSKLPSQWKKDFYNVAGRSEVSNGVGGKSEKEVELK